MTDTTQNKHLEDGFTSSIWLLFGAERLYGIYAENLKDAQKRIESKFDDPLQYNRPFIEFKLPASKEELCIQNRDVYFRKLINDNKDLLVDEGYPIGYMETDILEVESVEKAKGTLLQKYDSYEQPRFITIYEVSRTDINEKPLTFTVKAEAVKAARELAEKNQCPYDISITKKLMKSKRDSLKLIRVVPKTKEKFTKRKLYFFFGIMPTKYQKELQRDAKR